VLRRWPADDAPTCSGPRRVVNLGALWAGPLCAQLLQRGGMAVTDVEALARPDVTPPQFARVLRDGHVRRRLDFATADGRAELAAELRAADVVIEASRPRALQGLGVPAEVIMRDRVPRIWLRITGHGPRSGRIAFGDDAAVAGGLVAWDDGRPAFAGDALADPLTAILGALAVAACAHAGGSWLIELAMADAARLAAGSGPIVSGYDHSG
jgi:crotonobetainyl-CoA:carnitine CoA-transferase CaiB-like acyl-CoA transferase